MFRFYLPALDPALAIISLMDIPLSMRSIFLRLGIWSGETPILAARACSIAESTLPMTLDRSGTPSPPAAAAPAPPPPSPVPLPLSPLRSWRASKAVRLDLASFCCFSFFLRTSRNSSFFSAASASSFTSQGAAPAAAAGLGAVTGAWVRLDRLLRCLDGRAVGNGSEEGEETTGVGNGRAAAAGREPSTSPKSTRAAAADAEAMIREGR